jgi:hypothetical protein
VTNPGAILADEPRLRRVFDRLFRDCLERQTGPEQPDSEGEGAVTIRVGTTKEGFFVAEDGDGTPPPAAAGRGELAGGVDRGQSFPVVAGIATAHGWSIEAIEAPVGVTRFEVTDVEHPETY